ncbi:NucA/NucB deoxyribonuclease domain-containing protein [Paenibacillus crassostreae]|uniref:NucA/NucB deoxyribonuclease domain-containing protein n=1 Tax=Paenibacillus crassostreae TaxID=1763538 RepID=UPI001E33F499|nr:NucA/NucB deoxyribonuclease domain-containing protein [Paenibacillus crassostreae]
MIEIPKAKDVIVVETEADYYIEFPVDRYPKTAAHIQEAIEAGYSAICTIDRAGAEDNRDESLKGIPTKKGYDRDEWPMAMCKEGGAGADIAYITPSDNRGAGSWVGNQLENYPDGSRVEFIFPDKINRDLTTD